MRPDHRGWAAWFFALILVSAVLGLSGVRPNDIAEIDAAAPGWQPSRLLDDQYYREIDAWALDNGATEGIGRWTRYQVDYGFFNDSTSPDLVIGDNATIFNRALGEQPCDVLDTIDYPDLPGTENSDFLLSVSLPKAHFLRDLMPPHERPEECTVAARSALLERLAADPRNLDLNAIATAAPLANLSVTEPGFNATGRTWAALAIVDRFQTGLWEVDAIVQSTTQIQPAYGPRLGSMSEITVDDITVARDVSITVVREAEFFGVTSLKFTRASDAEVVPGATFLVGDTQLGALLPLLEPYFEELVFINWVQVGFAPVNLEALPIPNRVLIQVPEGRASELLANPIVASLAATIAPVEN